MKKLLIVGAVAIAALAASSQARAGVSFSISLGHHFPCAPVIVASPPVLCPPPVVVYPRHCPPPPPRYVYRHAHRDHHRCDRHCDDRKHRRHDRRWRHGDRD